MSKGSSGNDMASAALREEYFLAKGPTPYLNNEDKGERCSDCEWAGVYTI